MNLFNNKYRVDSIRLPDWDYSTNAIYFITICTSGKEHFFGKIEKEKMQFSQIGLIAKQYLSEIPNHFYYVRIDAFTIMPNHIHALIVMNQIKISVFNTSNKGIDDEDIFIDVRETLQCNVSTEGKDEYMSKISPEKGSISTVIRSYKSIVTREARKINPDFAWQERFHDHIVRYDTSYYKIKQYIKDNPKNWETDTFY
jgi:REP element-mobilizing transposase RayT